MEIVYDINGVVFTVFLLELKELSSDNPNFMEKGTIVSDAAQLMALHQFKNYQYVLRLTQNKGRIRVPLAMVTHYKGFTVYAKVLIPTI